MPVRLLAALPPGELAEFAADPHPVSLSLYEPGAPIEHVYFIRAGVASMLTAMTNGATIEVGMTGREGMLGAAMLLGAERSSQQVIVPVAGDAPHMKAARCKAMFERSAAARQTILRFAEAMLNQAAQTAACNRLHSIEQRCARWLLMAGDCYWADHDRFTQLWRSA